MGRDIRGLWMRAGEKAAYVFGMVLFGVLYWTVFAPVALVAKLCGKRFLPDPDPSADSYYYPRTSPPATLDEMRKQG